MTQRESKSLAFIRSAEDPSFEHLADMCVVDEQGKMTVVPLSLRHTLLIATTGLSLMHGNGVLQDAKQDDEDGSPSTIH